MTDAASHSHYDTIAQVLLAAARQGRYVEEEPTHDWYITSIYTLPEDAFAGASNYLIKWRHKKFYNELEKFEAVLQTTTALTPVSVGFARNVGQPVLKTDDFEIIKKVPGESLGALRRKNGRELYEEKMANLPPETWKQYFRDILWLTNQGVPVDMNIDNILLDESDPRNPRLRLIDMFDSKFSERLSLSYCGHQPDIMYDLARCNNLANVTEGLFLSEKTLHQLKSIAEELEFPPTARDFWKRGAGKKAFSTIHNIESLAALPLTAAPQELQRRLAEIEGYNRTQEERAI